MKATNKKPAVVQGDHKVGYGRPPVDRRFKPGQSGNPRGTSRKLKHTPHEEQLKGIVTDELYRKIPVRDGDRIDPERVKDKGDAQAQRDLCSTSKRSACGRQGSNASLAVVERDDGTPTGPLCGKFFIVCTLGLDGQSRSMR